MSSNSHYRQLGGQFQSQDPHSLSNDSGEKPGGKVAQAHHTGVHTVPSPTAQVPEVEFELDPRQETPNRNQILHAPPSKLLAETTSDDEIYSGHNKVDLHDRQGKQKQNNSFSESNNSSMLSG